MVKNDGGPAFPHNRLGSDSDGMTLRDYFAAMAMPALIQASASLPTHDEYSFAFASRNGLDFDDRGSLTSYAEDVATDAYEIADAMLVERRARP